MPYLCVLGESESVIIVCACEWRTCTLARPRGLVLLVTIDRNPPMAYLSTELHLF